jgi:fucose permease
VSISRVSYAGLFGTAAAVGLVASSLGPLIPLIRSKYEISITAAGLTFLVFSSAGLLGAVTALFFVAQLKARIGLAIALAVMSAGLLGIGWSPTYLTFLGATAFTGIGFGYLDVAINQVVGLGGGERRATLLLVMNSLFGVGAIFGPLVIGGAGVAGLPIVLSIVALLTLTLVAPISRLRGHVRTDTSLPPTNSLQRKIVALVAVGYFFYIGVEAGAAGWLSTHLIAVGWGVQEAAASTAAFWVAFTVGRLLAVPFTRYFSAPTLTVAAMVLTSFAMLIAMTPNLTFIGYLLVGAFCASVFPLGIAWISEALPGNPRATGGLVLVVTTGAAILPFLTGGVMDGVGAIYAAAVLLVPALLSATFFWLGLRANTAITNQKT